MADIALPAYISSMDVTHKLVCQINRRENGDTPSSNCQPWKILRTSSTLITTSLTQHHLYEEDLPPDLMISCHVPTRSDRAPPAGLRIPHTVVPGYPPYLWSAWGLLLL
ncbi:hypothetical protein Pcinc_039762 [Petrolisthes cinctipes]|uniref:Uncharacterized protein n=1 Tax=Petrolisthes cinctipes TaxID=88211 RepID=A0AAE1EJ73_PETCI|nr:hypothetical protein Pcinc_039762 [Petrolisthes cinctipes]